MRIAQVCPYSLSMPGGVQGQVLGLARALRDLGHEARVLAPCDGPPPDSMVTPLGNSVPTAANGSMAPIAPDPACALRTINALRNENFDILHLHEPLVPGPTATALLVSDAPMIGTFHAAGVRTSYDYFPWLGRKLAKKLKIRVAVSEDARKTAERNVHGRYEILFNGIEIDRFQFGVPHEKSGPTIFFVGRHEPRKGLAVLIAAMESMPADAHLWIAGHGPQTAALRTATHDNPRIEWLGRITEADKISRMRAADVFCAPSIEGESFGIVLLEAMAAGTPVVASDLPGYRSVVDGDANAVLFEPGNERALAESLRRVIESKSLTEQLEANGRERAEAFSMTRLATAYVDLYEKCASQYPFMV